MPEGQAYAATTMAFEAWRGLPRVPDLMLVSGEPLSIGHHEGGASNGVYLVRDWQSAPDQLAITVVTYSKSTGRVLDADILVNANADILLLDEGESDAAQHYDLGAILTHEAGHSLGLDESMTHPEATMWPRVSPGETHQRTLSDDDETGVITNYAGVIPEAAAGCGQASVLGRPARSGSTLPLALLSLVLLLGAARFALRSGLSRQKLAFGLGCALLAVPTTGGSQDGAQEGAALRAGSPAQWQAEHEAVAQARIAHAFGPAAKLSSLVRGRVRTIGSAWRDGVIVTQQTVRDASGAEHMLEVRGGSVGDIAQLWNHTAAPAADGDEIVVDASANHWAHVQDGTVWGGSLGEGPAIQIER
jgi:hypothetical protein